MSLKFVFEMKKVFDFHEDKRYNSKVIVLGAMTQPHEKGIKMLQDSYLNRRV